jgi:hypothetical protein
VKENRVKKHDREIVLPKISIYFIFFLYINQKKIVLWNNFFNSSQVRCLNGFNLCPYLGPLYQVFKLVISTEHKNYNYEYTYTNLPRLITLLWYLGDIIFLRYFLFCFVFYSHWIGMLPSFFFNKCCFNWT